MVGKILKTKLKKSALINLLLGCCFLAGCRGTNFDNGFLVLWAQCFNVSQNKSFSLEPQEFGNILNPICKRATKISQKSIIDQIKKDFDAKTEYVIRFRYAAFVDDHPAQIVITSDKILKFFNDYYQLKDNDYGSFKTFLDNSMKDFEEN